MLVLVMVTADMAIEYGTRIEVAVWMTKRPEKATPAAWVGCSDSRGLVVYGSTPRLCGGSRRPFSKPGAVMVAMPTRLEAPVARSPPLWPGAVAAWYTRSLPSLIR